jgi:hypothetical protein
MSITFACLWVVLAQVIAILPSRECHWRAASGLMALGHPLGVWLAWEVGAGALAAFALAAASLLRYGLRRVTGGRLG